MPLIPVFILSNVTPVSSAHFSNAFSIGITFSFSLLSENAVISSDANIEPLAPKVTLPLAPANDNEPV